MATRCRFSGLLEVGVDDNAKNKSSIKPDSREPTEVDSPRPRPPGRRPATTYLGIIASYENRNIALSDGE